MAFSKIICNTIACIAGGISVHAKGGKLEIPPAQKPVLSSLSVHWWTKNSDWSIILLD
jgi:hypothetical protein